MAEPFTKENYPDRGGNAALARTFLTPLALAAAVFLAIEVEQHWDFFEDVEISNGNQIVTTSVAAVIGIIVGMIWGNKRQKSIYGNSDNYPRT